MINNLDVNQQIALISAGAALLGSIIGAVSTLLATWFAKKLQENGTVSLHTKIVHTKGNSNKTWGYYRSQEKQGLYMQIPLWLDVCNTTGISRILRNVNLYAYSKKQEIASFNQIQRIGDGENATLLGDDESYTLVIPANSARRFNLEFILHEQDIPQEHRQFDELVFTYFDEKNNIKAFKLIAVENCWVEGSLPRDNKWISLNRRCKYAR